MKQKKLSKKRYSFIQKKVFHLDRADSKRFTHFRNGKETRTTQRQRDYSRGWLAGANSAFNDE